MNYRIVSSKNLTNYQELSKYVIDGHIVLKLT